MLHATIADQPPKIDGDLSDACWTKAPVVSDFYFKTDGTKACEPTTASICYDQRFIYVAFRCTDSQPDKIVCQQKKRGGRISSDDYVGVDLDCYGNFGRIVWFNVSAGGVQTEDLQNGDASKTEWKGDWIAASKREKDGYTVELAIPLAILQYDSNRTSMGVAFIRRNARVDQQWWSPHVGPTTDARRFYLWDGLKLPRLVKRPLIMAYSLLGAGQGDTPRQFGVDMKHSFTPNLTGVLSMNPDFRSVEQQVDSVDFTYVERLLPDGRPFFLEGGGYLPGSDLFYSRRVNQIDFGSKLYGTIGDYSLGVMDCQRVGKEGYTASSLSRSWPGKGSLGISAVNSFVGSYSNLAMGVGGSYRVYDLNDQKIDVGSSFGLTNRALASGNAKRMDQWVSCWGRPRVLGWSASHRIIDTEFDPYLGYVPEKGLESWDMGLSLFDRSPVKTMSGWRFNFGANTVNHSDGSLYYNGMSFNSRFTWRRGIGTSLNLRIGERPPYYDRRVGLSYWWGDKSLYRRGNVNLNIGKVAGGSYLDYSLGQGWDITSKMTIYTSYENSRIAAPSPEAYSSAQIVTTLAYDLSPERTLTGRMVLRNGKSNLYTAFRQKVRAGLDAYLLFGDPNAESTKAAVMLKVIRPI